MTLLKDEKTPGPPTETELLAMVRRHWQTHRPLTFKRLHQSSYLEEALQTAVYLTLTSMDQLIRRHQMDPWQAWALVREAWALLPAEEGPEMVQESRPLLMEMAAPAEDQDSGVVIVDDSPGMMGFAWPVCLAKCLRILGRLIGPT